MHVTFPCFDDRQIRAERTAGECNNEQHVLYDTNILGRSVQNVTYENVRKPFLKFSRAYFSYF